MEQLNNPLTFNCQYVNASGAGQTGLIVTVDIYRNGTLILNDQATIEIGGGIYAYTLDASYVNAEGVYLAQFSNATWGVITDRREVGLGGVEYLDAAISSRATVAGVWSHGTRTLTAFGTLIADIWSHSTRTLTAFIIGLLATIGSIQSLNTSVTEEEVVSGSVDVENL